MPPKKKQSSLIQQTAIGDGNVQVAGDNNTVNVKQTFIQKVINIFKSDAETTDQRNRRIMLGHVENFWVKGILEKSLHGAALLDLGIKEDPDALNYPWAIKREATKETLPTGISMLEIFQEIGMGRSLLILGAPGSGKTTMLLELTRQLIERAREDVTEPIPVVFNLSSWTEKLTLSDWLARELNTVYYVPKKVAPTWVKENKMLLLLDGLDEVRQESRHKCVEAINHFRRENGLTSMAVCSRSQDYGELKTRLSLDGAIEIQALTLEQVNEYFKLFGREFTGLRKMLEKDAVLREMAESPLFLSIMTLAYCDTDFANIPVAENIYEHHKLVFNVYIERMFTRSGRSKNKKFKKSDILHWLSWLACKMVEHSQSLFLIESIQPNWLDLKKKWGYRLLTGTLGGLVFGFIFGSLSGIINSSVVRYISRFQERFTNDQLKELGDLTTIPVSGSDFGLLALLVVGLILIMFFSSDKIKMVDSLKWDAKKARSGFLRWNVFALVLSLVFGIWLPWLSSGRKVDKFLFLGLILGSIFAAIGLLIYGLGNKSDDQTSGYRRTNPLLMRNIVVLFLTFELVVGFWGWQSGVTISKVNVGIFFGLIGALIFGSIIVLILRVSQINLVDAFHWDAKKGKTGLLAGLIIGLFFAMIAIWGNISSDFARFSLMGVLFLVVWGILGASLGSIGMLIYGLGSNPIEETSYPGQRIYMSLKNFLMVFLIYLFFVGFNGWFVGGALSVLIATQLLLRSSFLGSFFNIFYLGLVTGMISAMAGTLIGALAFGGLAVIQHFSLRLIIATNKLLPWRLIPFLDDCVDLIFLRRVGGGYIFVHRLLMEHFAEMYPADDK